MKFLIVKTSSLGDILQSLHCATYLKKKYKDCLIDWVVEERCSEVIDLSSDIDAKIVIKSPTWKKNIKNFYKDLKNLRLKKYDVIFDLQGNIKSALITGFAKGVDKVGFTLNCLPEWPNLLVTNKRFDVSNLQNRREAYLGILQHYFKETPGSMSAISPSAVRESSFMIAPGSRWKNKQLSPETWIEWLSLVRDKYNPFFLFLYGNEEEKVFSEHLQALFPNSLCIGNLPLKEWQALITKMQLLVGVDSAALHLATYSQIPTFSFFGPTHKDCYAPLGFHASIQGACPYGEVFTQRCKYLRSCRTAACIKTLKAGDLFEAFESWFDKIRKTTGDDF